MQPPTIDTALSYFACRTQGNLLSLSIKPFPLTALPRIHQTLLDLIECSPSTRVLVDLPDGCVRNSLIVGHLVQIRKTLQRGGREICFVDASPAPAALLSLMRHGFLHVCGTQAEGLAELNAELNPSETLPAWQLAKTLQGARKGHDCPFEARR
jgi:anti-anti-sigma regulatory factor